MTEEETGMAMAKLLLTDISTDVSVVDAARP
jgi:hypothetical protein